MAEQYPFRYKVKHSASRFASILPWFLLIGLIGYGLWIAFNKPTQRVTVQKGAEAKFTTINKTSRWFTLFTELGIENRNSNLSTYTRFGARVEF